MTHQDGRARNARASRTKAVGRAVVAGALLTSVGATAALALPAQLGLASATQGVSSGTGQSAALGPGSSSSGTHATSKGS